VRQPIRETKRDGHLGTSPGIIISANVLPGDCSPSINFDNSICAVTNTKNEESS